MKKLILGVAVIAFAALACKKNFDKQGFDARSTFAGPYDDTIVLDLTVTSDLTLSSNNLYILDGKCYITNNADLEIEEGTRIEAIKKSTNDSASALIITSGSTITASGTEDNPVVFTSNRSCPEAGDWGGIVILGNAPINKATRQSIEGINLPSVPVGVDVTFGGTDSMDNSGTLSYVRIEYAGAAIATDNELNGLTCGGVGAGTQLDHIEVAYGNDDAFEFFGGTVNASYLIALAPDDDAFDFDLGYRGGIQFAVSVLHPDLTYSANPNGIESDNDATGSADAPRTKALISNMTVIGVEDSTNARALNLLNGAFFRRNSSYAVRNSVFIGFPTGVNFSSAGSQADVANFQYNTVHGFVTTDAGASIDGTNAEIRSAIANGASVDLVNPFDICAPDFRPGVSSPLLTAGTDYTGLSGFFVSKSYRGAFANSGADANWATASWVRYDYSPYCVSCN